MAIKKWSAGVLAAQWRALSHSSPLQALEVSARAAARTAAARSSLSFLVDNAGNRRADRQALAEAFNAKNPDITIEVETRPQRRRRRQPRQDPAGHRRHDRHLHVQLGLAVPGAQPGAEPGPADRPAVRRRHLHELSSQWSQPTASSTAPRSAAHGRRRPLQQDDLRQARPAGAEDLGRVHGQQRQDQGGRQVAPVDPDLSATPGPRSCSCSATSTTCRPRCPTSPTKYTANKAKYATDAGRAEGLRAPAGGPRRRLPQQGLRLGQARRRRSRWSPPARARTTRC